MRDIKFRAWSVEKKRMIYLASAFGGDTYMTLNNSVWGVFEPDRDDYYGECTCNKRYGDILMQYTGLNDKNGKEICEGDILCGHGNDDDLCKVVYGEFYVIDVETYEKVEKVVGWHYEVIETDALSKAEPYCFPMPLTDYYIERGEFEIIGNIYENPELISKDGE